jgi:hypothetical protein
VVRIGFPGLEVASARKQCGTVDSKKKIHMMCNGIFRLEIAQESHEVL